MLKFSLYISILSISHNNFSIFKIYLLKKSIFVLEIPIVLVLSLSELLFDKNDLQKMNVLRRIIAPMGTMDAIEFISSKLKDTKNNAEFFNSMNKPA